MFGHENPENRRNSAPPVARNVTTRLIRFKMLKLTSTYEGLSFGRAEKKTRTEAAKNIRISQVSTLKSFDDVCRSVDL